MVAVIKGDMGKSASLLAHNRVAALQLDSVKKQQATGRTGNLLQKEAG